MCYSGAATHVNRAEPLRHLQEGPGERDRYHDAQGAGRVEVRAVPGAQPGGQDADPGPPGRHRDPGVRGEANPCPHLQPSC